MPVSKEMLQAIVENQYSTPEEIQEAEIAIKLLDTPVTKPVATEVATPATATAANVAAMLAQLEADPLTIQTPQELWDENFRIVPLKEAVTAMPNATGNDQDNAAEALRNDPEWMARFEQKYGKNPSVPVVVLCEPQVAPAPGVLAPKTKTIWDEVSAVLRPAIY